MKQYNAEQIAAINAPFDKNLVVIASAGSGKTEVVGARAAKYVKEHPEFESKVLLLSFTVKSANELKERVQLHIGRDTSVTATNIHAYGARLLHIWSSQYPNHSLVPAPSFQIMDASEQKRLIATSANSSIEDIDPIYRDDLVESAITAITGWNEDGTTLESLEQLNIPGMSENIAAYKTFLDEKRRQGLVDYADLINLPIEILSTHKDILKNTNGSIAQIFVDEYQDINEQQNKLIKLLSKKAVCNFVGDPDQAIYAFRGGRPDFLVKLAKSKKHTVISLLTNYRCKPNILLGANTIICHNQNRVKSTMKSFSSNDTTPMSFIRTEGDFEEADKIAELVSDSIGTGTAPSEIAILYRTNRQSRLIEQALAKRAVKHAVIGGPRFFDKPIIKTLCAYLKYALNTNNTVALLDVCKTPSKGLGTGFLNKLKNKASSNNTDTLFELSNCKEQGALKTFVQIVNIKEMIDQGHINDAIEYILKDCGVKESYTRKVDANKKSEIDSHVEQFIEVTSELSRETDISNFLEQLSLRAGDKDANQNVVRLMTIHASKGLEFQSVFLAGFNRSYIPHPIAQEQGDIEEERRLVLVALTRAKTNLTLSFPCDTSKASPLTQDFHPRAFDDHLMTYWL